MEADPTQLAAYEKDKRMRSEADYHDKLATMTEKMEAMEERMADTEKEAKKAERNYKQLKEINTNQEGEIKSLKATLEKQEDMVRMFQDSYKVDQQTIKQKDANLKSMQEKKAEFFREMKKAKGEVADLKATNEGLHKQIDNLEKEQAEAREQIDKDATYKDEIDNIHSIMESAFSEVKSDGLTTPEYVLKIKEYTQSLKRTDSHEDMRLEKNLSDELERSGLFGDEESDADEEGDKTLTMDVELAEMKQKVEEVQNELEESKSKEGGLQNQISMLTAELEEWRRAEKERKAAEGTLGFSGIISTDIEPVAPVLATVPAPPQPETIHVAAKPTVRDVWEQTPGWLTFLLALSVAVLAYLWITTMQERSLWLGANDASRLGAVRVALRRHEAYCSQQGQFEGVLAPLWFAVQGWLGLPLPTLLT